jgi:hypothetical protein
MYPDEPQLAISRVLDAPRELAFRAFTDPDHLATWWGPSGNTLPRDEIELDVRPGGFQRSPSFLRRVATWTSMGWSAHTSADPTPSPEVAGG